jgi:hypothetical protein
MMISPIITTPYLTFPANVHPSAAVASASTEFDALRALLIRLLDDSFATRPSIRDTHALITHMIDQWYACMHCNHCH